MEALVMGTNEEVIIGNDEVKKRWSEFSEGLMNVFDDRVADSGYLC